MKISFYELFDLMAEEALELLSEDTPDSETQSSSEATINGVLEMISQKERPHVFKKKKMIRRLLLAAVIGIGVSAAAVAVANQPIILNGVLLRIGAEEINDANRAYVGKEMRAGHTAGKVQRESEIREEAAAGTSSRMESERTYELPDFIKDIESYEKLPYAMDTFESKKEDGYDTTPEIIFTNNAMVIFTKEGNKGWKLKKGQTLHFETEEYPSEVNQGRGQAIIYTYILDGKLMNQDYGDGRRGLSQKYDLKAEKSGEYYLCLTGASSDPISIKSGRLYVE